MMTSAQVINSSEQHLTRTRTPTRTRTLASGCCSAPSLSDSVSWFTLCYDNNTDSFFCSSRGEEVSGAFVQPRPYQHGCRLCHHSCTQAAEWRPASSATLITDQLAACERASAAVSSSNHSTSATGLLMGSSLSWHARRNIMECHSFLPHLKQHEKYCSEMSFSQRAFEGLVKQEKEKKKKESGTEWKQSSRMFLLF